MTEELLVHHCAPTLAGLKVGALVNTDFENFDCFQAWVDEVNQKLTAKGVRVCPLRVRERRALLYVYRPKQLAITLAREEVSQILSQFGYQHGVSVEEALERLKLNLQESDAFPHEIGLFLGYPAEDVQGFIENRGCGAKMSGIWKVYSDVEKAARMFCRFRKCSEIYAARWREGLTLARLTVAI